MWLLARHGTLEGPHSSSMVQWVNDQRCLSVCVLHASPTRSLWSQQTKASGIIQGQLAMLRLAEVITEHCPRQDSDIHPDNCRWMTSLQSRTSINSSTSRLIRTPERSGPTSGYCYYTDQPITTQDTATQTDQSQPRTLLHRPTNHSPGHCYTDRPITAQDTATQTDQSQPRTLLHRPTHHSPEHYYTDRPITAQDTATQTDQSPPRTLLHRPTNHSPEHCYTD